MKKQMLFKHPGRFKFNGEWFDFVLVDKSAVAEYIRRGWHLTKQEAINAHQANQTTEILKRRKANELTRPEIEEIAIAEGTYKELAERFNISMYALKKIKAGEL